MTKKNKSYTTEFKFKVALDAIRGELTFNEMTTKYGVHAAQISRWKQVALDCIKNSFINNKTEKFSQDGVLRSQWHSVKIFFLPF